MGLPRHIIKRGDFWSFKRRVPDRARALDPRDFVVIALETDSERVALQKARQMSADLELYWDHLAAAQKEAAEARHKAIMRIAKSHGFEYRAAEDLELAEAREIIARFERLQAVTPVGQPPATDVRDALLGGSEPPGMTISEVVKCYFADNQEKELRKSPRQAKHWRQVRERARDVFIAAVGDKQVDKITRPDLLEWRNALWERIKAGEIVEETANKTISRLCAMLRDVQKRRHIELPDLTGLKFETVEATVRATYDPAFIRDVVLAPGALDGANDQARAIIWAVIETGMRPSEVVNIVPEHIKLDAPIPHVQIRATPTRQLKTLQSKRDIPLVGVALDAYRAFPRGFPRYFDNEDTLSATVNKFLRENGLAPLENQTLYSFRHAFEDRMIAAGAGERMRSEMMGHKYQREKYGHGPSLAMKLELLQKMALKAAGSA